MAAPGGAGGGARALPAGPTRASGAGWAALPSVHPLTGRPVAADNGVFVHHCRGGPRGALAPSSKPGDHARQGRDLCKQRQVRRPGQLPGLGAPRAAANSPGPARPALPAAGPPGPAVRPGRAAGVPHVGPSPAHPKAGPEPAGWLADRPLGRAGFPPLLRRELRALCTAPPSGASNNEDFLARQLITPRHPRAGACPQGPSCHSGG